MEISKKDVEHIAKLARIELRESEMEKFAGELSSIFGFIETLNLVETGSVKPMAGGTALESKMRKDAQVETTLEQKHAELLSQAPDKKDSWVRVKSVFE